jgi:hypothetical protein
LLRLNINPNVFSAIILAHRLLDSGRVNTAVLLIDDELGFAFWLGRALDQEGFQAFPARSVSSAAELLSTLHLSVSLVIINHSLAGVHNFVDRLRPAPQNVKVVLLVGPDENVSTLPGADVVWRKPRVMNESTRAEWVQRVKELFVNSATAVSF